MENLKCKALSQSKEVLLFVEVDFFLVNGNYIIFIFFETLCAEDRAQSLVYVRKQVPGNNLLFFTFSYVSMCISVHFRGGSERGQSN